MLIALSYIKSPSFWVDVNKSIVLMLCLCLILDCCDFYIRKKKLVAQIPSGRSGFIYINSPAFILMIGLLVIYQTVFLKGLHTIFSQCWSIYVLCFSCTHSFIHSFNNGQSHGRFFFFFKVIIFFVSLSVILDQNRFVYFFFIFFF